MTAPMVSRLLTLVLGGGLLLVLVFGGLSISSAASATRSRGILDVSSLDNATLSISQDKSQAQVIGIGKAKAWLQPGTYELVARAAGDRASQVVTVTAKETTVVHIIPSPRPLIPSVGGVTYQNTDTLLNMGLTTTQVAAFKRLVFNYKTSAQVVSIDSSSLKSGPINPNGNPRFTITFTLRIDNDSYTATIGYSDLLNIQLRLVNQQTGEQALNTSTQPQVLTAD